MQYWPSWQALESNEYRAGAVVRVDKRGADPQWWVLNIEWLIQGVWAQDVRGTRLSANEDLGCDVAAMDETSVPRCFP